MTEDTPAFKRDTNLPFQKIDEEVVIVDPARRDLYLLNETATRVWELCAIVRSEDEIVSALSEEYEAPVAEIRAEAVGILNAMRAKDLLVNP